ncbi:hypothetical protein TOK_5452 [Pseudonocardia sp. N23]|nr:hypothetical protein TOK_5452 [Pseudonocardia sp. N23]
MEPRRPLLVFLAALTVVGMHAIVTRSAAALPPASTSSARARRLVN